MKTIAAIKTLAATGTVALLPIIADSAIKGAIILAIVGIIMIAMRGMSASGRHLVWVCAAAALIVLPVLSATLPKWSVLPNWTVTESEPVAPSTTGMAAFSPAVIVDTIPVSAAVATPHEPVKAAESSALSIGQIAILVWAFGSVLLLFRLVRGRLRLALLARKSAVVDEGNLHGSVEKLRKALGIRRRVRVLLSSKRNAMPMTWGTLHPCLLVPSGAESWDTEKQRAVLLHELAHIRRADTATQLLVQIACALHWFNPLVWIAARRVHVERERACDDLVLRHGMRPSDYAEHLLHIVSGQEFTAPAGYGAVAMARPSNLEGRLVAILNQKRNRRALTRGMFVLCAIGFAVLVLPMAMLDATGDEPKTPVEEVPASGVEPTPPEDPVAADTPAKPDAVETAPLVPDTINPVPAEPASTPAAPLPVPEPVIPPTIDEVVKPKRTADAPDVKIREPFTIIESAPRSGTSSSVSLRAAKEHLEQLRKVFTDKHPNVIATKARIKALEERVAKENTQKLARRLGVPRELVNEPVEYPSAKSFAGIGAALTLDEESGYPKIGTLLDGPAKKSGKVKVGDLIKAAGNGDKGPMTELKHVRLEKVVALLRGKEGTKVRLRVCRRSDGKWEEEMVQLVRAALHAVDPSVVHPGAADPDARPDVFVPAPGQKPRLFTLPKEPAQVNPTTPPLSFLERRKAQVVPAPPKRKTTAVIPLEFLEVAEFQKIAEIILEDSPSSKTVAEPQSNSLIYMGTPEGLELLQSILKQLDKDSAGARKSSDDDKPKETSSFERKPGASVLNLDFPKNTPYRTVIETIEEATKSGSAIRLRAIEDAVPPESKPNPSL